MFETYAVTEIPFSKEYEKNGIKVWGFVERKIHSPWFHVTCRGIDAVDKIEYTPIMFYSDVKQLLALNEHKASVKILSIEIVTPPYMNGSKHWKMEPLKEIWEAQTPKYHGISTHIYMLNNGRSYIHPITELKESELKNKQLLLKL